MDVLVLALLALCFPSPSLPSDPPHVAAYELDVRFEPEAGTLQARAVVHLDPEELPADRLTFFLHGELRVQMIEAAGRRVAFETEQVFYDADYSLIATAVHVPTAELDVSDGLAVVYGGPFHASRARSASDYMRIDEDGVHLRAFGYSPWFPLFLGPDDDSHLVAFLGVRIDTPEAYVPVFVGHRLGSRVEGGRRITEWEAECDLFDPQCTARRFEVAEADGTSVYFLPGTPAEASVDAVLGFATEVTEACRRAYGDPGGASELHVVQTARFGDIASGNVVGIADDRWSGFERNEATQVTLAHELVHTFVSVPVRRSDPLYALFVEGFPSYFHLPVLDEVLGGGFLEKRIAEIERAYLQRRGGPDLPPEVPLSAIGPDEIGLYKDRFLLSDRALLFLDHLRRRMGAQGFREFCHELFALETVDRGRFEAAVLARLPDAGDDLQTWLDTSELPEALRVGS